MEIVETASLIDDYFMLNTLLTAEERTVRDTIRHFVDAEVRANAGQWWLEGSFPTHLIPRLADLGVFGAMLPEQYGGVGLSPVGYGLIMQELERGDSGLRSLASVQSSLAMYAIYRFASESQKLQYLSAMVRGEIIGCFGLTEPDAGSDPGAMRTRAHQTDSGYVISGSKRWITNGNLAQIAVIWAKDDAGVVRGFIVPTESAGFTAKKIETKASMRMSVTSELYLDNVEVSKSALMPNSRGLGSPLTCLTQARYGIVWGVVGAAMDCMAEAAEYVKTRMAFSRPLSRTQLIQERLVDMLSKIVAMQLRAFQLGRLYQEGTLRPPQVALAKRDNARAALDVARMAREILGGNGISVDYGAIRHMSNLETVDTYEGTYEVHTLAVGRDLLHENAF